MPPPKLPPKPIPKILSAKVITPNYVQIVFDVSDHRIRNQDIRIDVDVKIKRIKAKNASITLHTTDLDYRQNYIVKIKRVGELPLDTSILMEELHTDKPLGFTVENNRTVFRLFAPRATGVKLVLFEKHTDDLGVEHEMQLGERGVWQCVLEGTFWNRYYGYKVAGPNGPTEIFQPDQMIADPYSQAVCTKNTYLHEAKSIMIKPNGFDWEGDTFLDIRWEDLITYEMHVRDMTVHDSAKIEKKGTYLGLIEEKAVGGMAYIRDLGVNAVELLPCQEFGNLEIPYKQSVNGKINTWNPYARNHWGYMTSYFFAPESYYASGGTLISGDYCGIHGQQVNEFKEMVKAFHQEGLAVIMDVVYNHVSHYDWNPLKHIDKKYFFRLDPHMNFLSTSGCGNDLRTESPMARRLIVDSIKHWLEEYHVDGFRFDLAAMIDWETIEQITEEARKINPNVILIAEPWGGGNYDLAGFSQRGWAAWNDLYRNGVKGQNPDNGLGWIFGQAWGHDNLDSIKFYLRGCTKDYGGPFAGPHHSVNYLESHDDHTLGDFIRIGTRDVEPHEVILDLDANARLTAQQMNISKLAALFQFTSQGQAMIAEGQEFGRSKVVAVNGVPDVTPGVIDHNSYNKDDETNWLNFDHKEINRELYDYYRGLIQLRKAHAAFSRTPLSAIRFLEASHQFSVGFVLPKEASNDQNSFVVLLNSSPNHESRFELPEGRWRMVVDQHRAGVLAFGEVMTGAISLPAQSGMVLIQS
ncbi:alpha-amylase family glycosyl hydrolase [bacterium]|nr:alpha-amylase family glycosyl hydrolase [bacterium]